MTQNSSIMLTVTQSTSRWSARVCDISMARKSSKPSSSTAWHMCHCGKSFARKEHLTRHQASHGKPAYTCIVCQRRFGRRDVLRRHSLMHQTNHTRSIVSCDACRANKTKCSGGTPCSLCTRRGIDCTFQSGLRPLKGNLTSDTRIVDRTSDCDDGNTFGSRPMSSPSSKSGTVLAKDSLRMEPSYESFLTLSVLRSRPPATGEFMAQTPGMETILSLLVAEKPSLEETMQDSNELHSWVSGCFDAYVKDFHLRWPVINAPSFDLVMAPLHLAAPVFVIGTWLRSNVERNEISCALRVHEFLLQRFLHELVDFKSVREGQPWPIDSFQAILLTLIFSLYRTDTCILSKARLLRSMFITRLREIGAFNAAVLVDHLKAHYRGSYAPYTFSMREMFRRLLALTYQFDVYFGLVHEEPPMLHRQEVGTDLPCSFAVWNAYGINVFAKRVPEEPSGRSEFLISEITDRPSSFTSSQLLVEDVHLGLCGVFQEIWVHMQPLSSNREGYISNKIQSSLPSEKLDAWKNELDKIKTLADKNSTMCDTTDCFLMAYRGEGNSAAESLDRITTLIQDGMVLFYYLKLYHYAGVGIKDAKQDDDTSLGSETWWASKNRREALICSFRMLKMIDSMSASGPSISPLIRHALARGLNVIRGLVSHQKCDCRKKPIQSGITDLEQWTEIDGRICIDGTPACICKYGLLIEKFKRVIARHTIYPAGPRA